MPFLVRLHVGQASNLRGRLAWFQESRGQLCVWNKEHLVEFYVFSSVIGVFAGCLSASVRMHRKKGFAFAVREGCRELASEVGRVSERTRFKSSSRSVRAGSRALRSIAPVVVLECSSSDENEVSLVRKESRADFPDVSQHLLQPFGWRLVAYGVFFHFDNVTIL